MNIIIGGAAGQGMDTIAELLGKTFARAGYGVLLTKDYMSRVRGGHNFSVLTIDRATPWVAPETADVLVALNEETYMLHADKLKSTGVIIFDPALFSLAAGDQRGLPIPLAALARDSGGSVTASAVATGAVLAFVESDQHITETLLQEKFAAGIAAQNISALQAGCQALQNSSGARHPLPPSTNSMPQLFLDGSQTLGMSALGSGCRFLAAYPMTPATGVMTYLAAKQGEFEVVVEQAEDEIAAINMALGASYAGVRSMTTTSGGGFALMVEGLSLAGMTETPLVIVLAMRPGPATGLPTRTEQGDLDFAIFGGHGEFPRAVLSATHTEDAFYRLNKAFQLADKYQVPVIFLSDQNFADTARTIAPLDFTRLTYDQHLVHKDTATLPYQRYRLTADGISPRAIPGQLPREVVLADSDEHDEDGHIIEDAATRKIMMDKRLSRLQALAQEMDEPVLYGDEAAEILLIAWGSTYGTMREAVDILAQLGKSACLLHFADIWPLPQTRISALLPKARHSFCFENNATGQFAALLRRETGLQATHQVLKYDGRTFSAAQIVREVTTYA